MLKKNYTSKYLAKFCSNTDQPADVSQPHELAARVAQNLYKSKPFLLTLTVMKSKGVL
ncbi:hypothetical protein DPMN_027383 [Dreissena polymorpha]|uniref:Uncharacterized protein n=1 Tax=Dreissena polymorpha TaxID=45954 RepID=A0A9D4LUN5_DREPO|nr:hypothetical protein DPMN_027383 [Dreissena polymorpha]